ncbi:MAG TPA: sulfoacetaldehyde acetyltransferase [Acidimicrobiales bacterium]|jgi:sulfoacetaldehyde acetyltransferase|nr:sulfoacetaldehyde acetyltransferase [Acidimicrobiales bacterium]MDP7125805.1 sulfoacetaldehyde acetyltransferase [Acidimicrobiales bacterium]MDP7507551.1 sulfoacetaldehyde acetyltransferase [Acidimicrobiales bacterium]MEE1563610.1 sulfoacetaldehyde acetyltransferase [Acidimicrobiales bacterium]HJL75635.1 sulfoacetaldehyde acetyltransferase [Acidimicrobiales bacterium]|tara:strand:- start:436 stop:2202 length:1767 start_codon:yes stop_codon:yes gene_type:complete
MTRMTPSEAFVETLVANGVETAFGIMGSAFMDAMDIFTPAGIRLVPVVHEQGAAHMADGFARVSGRHGVVIGQNGPGISNCVTAIAAAFWAHSPVVIVTPETGTMGIGLGGFQEANQLPMFEEFTKYQGHIVNEKRMAELTARCFDRAILEMGPTQLNIPRDRFYGEIDVEIPEPIRIERGAGGEQSLDEAADLLASAEFPVLLAGGGVVMGDAVAETIELAERLGCPVVNSYLHNDSFPASHPQWCGPLGYQGSKAAMKLITRADVVLALGTRLGPFGTLPQHDMDYWPADARIIQVDADAKMLGLVKKVSVGICGDAGAAARALTARLADRTLACDATRDERAAATAAEKANWEAELDDWTHETDDFSIDMIKEAIDEEDNWLHPRQVLRELEKAMPPRVMVSTDIGNINSVANSYLRFEEPRSFFAAMSWGNCGYALPTIIGAKAAAPDRPAVSYAGDGAWAMSMVEVMTAVRHDIPVTAIVFHNRQWGAEKKNQVDFYGRRFVAGELDGDEDYSEIARAMGAEGVRVDQLEDVGPALRAAIDAQMTDGRTTVVEIMCTKELGDPFRKDALSRPVRNLEKYTDFV